MALSSFGGWLSDKKGERASIVGGFIIISLGWLVFIFGRHFYQFAVSHVLAGVGRALISPAYSSLISKAVPEKLRGMAFGFFATSLGVISLPAPWLGAKLWEAFTPLTPFYILVVALILPLPIMWFKFKLPSESPGEADEGDAPADEVLSDAYPVTD